MFARLAVLAVLVAAFAPGAPAEGDLVERIDAVMEQYVKEGGPGAVVAVIREGELIFKKAYGLADLKAVEQMTTDRVFDLASCSKNLTAYGVMLLAERGRLSLEDDVRKYLPELPPPKEGRAIRVIDLLHMISGLAGYQDLLDSYQGMTNEDIVPLVAAEELEFPTGSKYEYSNTDYNLLATMCARVSKMPFGDYMKKEVFDPLGMSHTVVQEKARQPIPGRVHGYKEEEDEWVLDKEDTPGIVGDGSIFSCVEDLARYDAALRDGSLVSSGMLERAWTAGATDDGRSTKYGFGWGIDDDGDGGLLVEHSGSWSGTSAYFGRWVDKDYSIILLSNGADADWGDASQGISEAVEEEEE